MDQHLRDPWIDHLTAYGFDVLAIYKGIVARSKGRHREFVDHLLKKCSILPTIKPQIQHYFKTVSPYLLPEQVKSTLRSKFALSTHTINFLFNQYFWAEQADTDLLFQYLQRLTIQQNPPFRIKIKTRRSIYQTMVLITPQMHNNFLRYGDVVTVSFNFVPLKRSGFMRTMYLALFTGIDDCGGISLFGIGVVSGTSADLKALAIAWFIELTQTSKSFSIVSQNSPVLQQQLDRINKHRQNKVRFFENWHHSIQKATFFYRQQPQNQLIVELVKKALKTFNKKQISEIEVKLKMLCNFSKNYLNELQMKTMSCHTDNAPSFIGFQVYASKIKMMEKMVSGQIPYCNTLGKLIMHCLRLEQNLKSKAENKMNHTPDPEQFFSKNNTPISAEILVLLKTLNFEIFKKFIYNYIAANNSCRIRQHLEEPLVVTIYQSSFNDNERERISEGYILQKQRQYTVRYLLQYQHWQCQCHLLEWSGIPCAHLITVIQYYGGSLLYYINTRWFPKNFKIDQIEAMLSQDEKSLITESKQLTKVKQYDNPQLIKPPNNQYIKIQSQTLPFSTQSAKVEEMQLVKDNMRKLFMKNTQNKMDNAIEIKDSEDEEEDKNDEGYKEIIGKLAALKKGYENDMEGRNFSDKLGKNYQDEEDEYNGYGIEMEEEDEYQMQQGKYHEDPYNSQKQKNSPIQIIQVNNSHSNSP